MQRNKWINWLVFAGLCLIWGSSFILMKLGMYDTKGENLLSAYQVGALRMLAAGIVLLPFAPKAFKRLPDAKTGWYIFLSGLLGSFFPAFLFCLAETKVDSSIAGTLNAMTPFFVLLVSTIVYRNHIPADKWTGIFIGFFGCLLLFSGRQSSTAGSWMYAMLVVLATLSYGFNVNMVKHRLLHISSTEIATLAFVFLIPFSAAVLLLTNYFQLPLQEARYLGATLASTTLGVMGTAIASILFYVLVKRAGIVFPSLVTYGIPFVAIGWGVYFGESIGIAQLGGLLIILVGVFLANGGAALIAGWVKQKTPEA